MTDTNSQFITTCPIGCGNAFNLTDIILAEGPLKKCSVCGQLVSQCSEERFRQSMAEFNVPQGTWPTEENAPSLYRSVEKLLRQIEKITNRPRS
ncbi:MAG: hypothetical protein OEV91_03705, partial [Desulfobulbaceae bacterium]|nr:hypothetical protein [Desulfobulbaceae bacterium]